MIVVVSRLQGTTGNKVPAFWSLRSSLSQMRNIEESTSVCYRTNQYGTILDKKKKTNDRHATLFGRQETNKIFFHSFVFFLFTTIFSFYFDESFIQKWFWVFAINLAQDKVKQILEC